MQGTTLPSTQTAFIDLVPILEQRRLGARADDDKDACACAFVRLERAVLQTADIMEFGRQCNTAAARLAISDFLKRCDQLSLPPAVRGAAVELMTCIGELEIIADDRQLSEQWVSTMVGVLNAMRLVLQPALAPFLFAHPPQPDDFLQEPV